MSGEAGVFDIVVAALLAVSTLIGFARGSIREILSVAAFIAAALATYAGAPLAWGAIESVISPPWLAKLITVFAIFMGVYLAVAMVTTTIEKMVYNHGEFGLIDRIVGAGFGVLRALVIAGLGLILLQAATPEDKLPHQARTYGLVEASAKMLKSASDPGSLLGRLVRRGAASDR